MKVNVIAGNSEVKEMRRQDGSVMVVKQEMYVDLQSSAFPVRCFLAVERPLQPGVYDASLPFKVGKFGDLEVNPFEPGSFSPLKSEQKA